MIENRSNLTIRLNDGRNLGYSIFGDQKSEKAILYFHGWPGTRIEAEPFHEIAKELNIKIIAVDRPGCGLSDFQEERAIKDFPNDIDQLCSNLKINLHSIIGFSTGGLYALECALQLSREIKNVGLVSAVPYFQIPIKKGQIKKSLKLAIKTLRIPLLSTLVLNFAVKATINQYKKEPEKKFQRSLKKKPKMDQEIWLSTQMREWLFRRFIPSLINSCEKGFIQDLKLLLTNYQKPVSKELAQNIRQKIYLWHGTLDEVVPVSVSQQQSKLFQNFELTLFEGEGHNSIFRHYSEILEKVSNE